MKNLRDVSHFFSLKECDIYFEKIHSNSEFCVLLFKNIYEKHYFYFVFQKFICCIDPCFKINFTKSKLLWKE